MDSAHICIKLSARSAKHDVADAAQPRNVSESQHGNVDYESNSTPHAGSCVDLRNFTPVTCKYRPYKL